MVSLTARDASEFSARYRGAWQALGRDLDDLPFIGMTRHVLVADTDREARNIAKRAFEVWYNCLPISAGRTALPLHRIYSRRSTRTPKKVVS